MKIKLLGILFLLSIGFSSFATHGLNMGGDLTWECLGNGKYKFHINLFYSCDSISTTAPPTTIPISSNGNITTISCLKISETDVTPSCGGANGIICTDGDLTTVRRIEYESAPIQLQGLPPATGWDFEASICCRATSSNTLDKTAIFLRATMFAPAGLTSADPCYDSSPKFLKDPHIFVSSATMQTISFADMQDVDGDSVVVNWITPKGTGGVNIGYEPNYSFNQPIPSSTVNPLNVDGVLDPTSGFYKFSSYTNGRFVYAIELSSYRNGQLIAKVMREMPLIIAASPNVPGPCAINNNEVPTVSVTSATNTIVAKTNFIGDTTHYKVFASPGDSVSFNITGVDIDIKSNCIPQSIQFTGTGSALSLDSLYQDASLTNVNGPAATITSLNLNGGFESVLSNAVQLNWKIVNSHTSIGVNGYYQFNFKFQDDNCPIPGAAQVSVRVILSRPFALSDDSTAICLGDSATVSVAGANSNMTWSPTAGVSMVSQGVYNLSPLVSTFYTVTDVTSGYTEEVYVQVDNSVTPQIGAVGNDLVLLNANTYDSLVWTLNGAPIYTAPPHDKITPIYSGSYILEAYQGVCVKSSNTIDSSFASNFTLNPNLKGAFNGAENGDMSFGINVLNMGNSDLTVDYITLFVNHENAAALDARFRIFDVNTNQVFFTDSVASVQEGMIEMHGSFTFQKNGSYFMSFYFGDDMHAAMFKATNWPVVSQNGMISVANAAKANGNASLPSQTSDSYPYIHFNFNGSIGIEENGLNTLTFYPNPTTQLLNMPEADVYEVLDLSGRVVLKSELTEAVNVEALKAGAYIIRNSKGASNTFIKQ